MVVALLGRASLSDRSKFVLVRCKPFPDDVALAAGKLRGSLSGQSCVVLCTGPSLIGFDWDRLSGQNVIACNCAIQSVEPTIAFTMDRRWIKKIREGLYGKALQVREAELPLMLRRPSGLEVPANTGISALALAVFMGADPIYLLGVDLKYGPNGEKHFHAGVRSDPLAYMNVYYQRWYSNFKKKEEEAGRLPRIVNLNPDSNLKCFEFGDVDEALPKAEAAK